MTLAELIEQRRAVLGGRKPLDYRELSARARAQGYTLADSTINAFVNHPIGDSTVKKRTLRALAFVLAVPYRTVVEALAATMIAEETGERVELVQAADEPDVQAWVTLTADRTAAERQQMIDMLRSVASMLSATHARETAGDVTNIGDTGRPRKSRRSR